MMVSLSSSSAYIRLDIDGLISNHRTFHVATRAKYIKLPQSIPRGRSAASVGSNPENVRSRECRLRIECQTTTEDDRYSGARGRSSSRGRSGRGRPGGGRGRGRSGARLFIRSNGDQHLGTSLKQKPRPFPGPRGKDGPPLRILPIGGLGEIGMNCMLVGHYDRYVLVDAGLMFPDYDELGIQKVLPDVSFIAQYKDKIEAVFITHGHEDHIGAMPWVIPALDPRTPVFSGGFTMELIKRRMLEYNLWEPARFRRVDRGDKFQAGPFEIETIRVTHSIPDCFGCIFRCKDGTIVHTGDWKIDEDPVDGQMFDRRAFEVAGKEGVTLMMSDSTNVLSPGRTTSERDVEAALVRRVQGHPGRIIATQFASNLHRIHSMKKAADSVNRRICFMGTSLTTYLEAAFRNGSAPFDPRELVDPSEIQDMDPRELLIITTGSQAEPQAQLALASRGASKMLELRPEDMLLYSAKMIPGNEKRVIRLMNQVATKGTQIVMGAQEGLHTSGHAHYNELQEVMRLTAPQHFLPVHGEVSFLKAHERMARLNGIDHTCVIQNGTMIGCGHRRTAREFSTTAVPMDVVPSPPQRKAGQQGAGAWDNGNSADSTATTSGDMQILGEIPLYRLYNDGNNGTGNKEEMFMDERMALATDGIVIASVEIVRSAITALRPEGGGEEEGEEGLEGVVRITTRGMWIDEGRLLMEMQMAAESALRKVRRNSTIVYIERTVSNEIRKVVRKVAKKKPDVICIAHESVQGVMDAGTLSRGIQAEGGQRPAPSNANSPNKRRSPGRPRKTEG